MRLIGCWAALSLLSSFTLTAQRTMVRSDSLGQDPNKERLCAERARNGAYWIEFNGRLASEGWAPEKIAAAWKDTNLRAKIISQEKLLTPISGNLAPFKVSDALAENAHWNGVHTLIALNSGVTATLVECYSGMRGDQPPTVELVLSSADSRWGMLTKEDLVPPSSKPDHKSDNSKTEVEQLKYERQHLTRVLKAIDAIQHASSFAQRARIFCRSQFVAFPMLPWLGSVEDLEANYEEWQRYEPRTQEEEVKRQQMLRPIRERLAQASRICKRA